MSQPKLLVGSLKGYSLLTKPHLGSLRGLGPQARENQGMVGKILGVRQNETKGGPGEHSIRMSMGRRVRGRQMQRRSNVRRREQREQGLRLGLRVEGGEVG